MFRIIFACGVVTTIVLNIALDSLPGWVFLTVILGIQLLTMGVATQIMDLKGEVKAEEGRQVERDELLTVSSTN